MENNKIEFVRTRDCCKRFGISSSTWWRLVKEGKAPPAIRMATRTTVWRSDFIDEMAQLILDGKDWSHRQPSEQAEV
ncbi:prophage CP4-57 regulatory protein [Mariprofundus micogutta]|uniref:Prophage CP4-57 regulatory protein n=1 Tax=Mariprofundus micogutta TaxID=1921010 RepID=A0A1L8CLY5_9PROT|nr:AlpA family phage regulatory protein [Mariprofundus micogutta]GAV19914.1 prophage CP4-57 regulatory protein [Mariprofundus micogutta]